MTTWSDTGSIQTGWDSSLAEILSIKYLNNSYKFDIMYVDINGHSRRLDQYKTITQQQTAWRSYE